MKRIFTLLILPVMAIVFPISEFKRDAVLEKEIQGDWLAAEYYMAQPPPELQQSIKSISFQANSIVEWEYVQSGKMRKASGRYGIYSIPKGEEISIGRLRLIVAPTNYADPMLSSHHLLVLSDFELDYDSRFLQSWGRLIKAKNPDGKRILFIRKND